MDFSRLPLDEGNAAGNHSGGAPSATGPRLMISRHDDSAALQEALALHKQGRLGDAADLYRQTLKENPAQPTALHLMGLVTAQQGQAEEAVVYLHKALAADPRSALCYSDLGLLYVGLERFDEAVSAFRRAIELQPHFPDALCRWGNFYREFGYFDEAKSCYERALSQEPQFTEAAESIGALQKSQQNISATALMIERRLREGEQITSCELAPTPIERRELLPFLLNQLGLTDIGVEIGVKEGKFSERILRHWKGRLLYSIDPWREFPTADYADISNVPQSKQDRIYMETIQRLKPFDRRSVIWRMTSREAAELLPDSTLDFCYIDADHSYAGVRDDLRLWYPKMRSGGMLAGHDFITDGTYDFGVFGVQKAVKEFAESYALEINVTNESEGGFPSWFVIMK